MMDQKKGPPTVADAILEVLSTQEDSAKAGFLISRVMDQLDTTEDAVRSELSKLKSAKRIIQPRYGYYALPGGHSNTESVEEEGVAANAAIVFRHAETNEVWATAELILRVRVHKPMNIVGGKSGGGLTIEGEAE